MRRLLNGQIARLRDLYARKTLDGVAYARWKGVSVGKDCRIYTQSFGSEPFLISIGDRVTIAGGVHLITHDGSSWLLRDEHGKRYQAIAGIAIGSNVFIGVNSILMPGVTIGSNVVVGAGSIVTRDVPDGVIAAGNPLRVIRAFDEWAAAAKERFVPEADIPVDLAFEPKARLIAEHYARRRAASVNSGERAT